MYNKYVIKNLSSNKSLELKFKLLSNFIDKTCGAIIFKETGLILKTRFGIHTFFLKNPLDIVVLDNNNKVKKTRKGLKPWRIFLWNPIFCTVIELPEGTIEKLEIAKGDIIKINL